MLLTQASRTDVTEYVSGMRWSLEDSCRWTFWRNGLASKKHGYKIINYWYSFRELHYSRAA